MKVIEFYKSQLDSNQTKLYDYLYSEIVNGNFSIKFKGYSIKSIQKVYEALYLDHVELYYLSYDAIISQEEEQIGNKTSIDSKIVVRDIYPNKIKMEIIKRFNLAVKRIKSILPVNPSELDIEVAVLKYIHRICYSDIDDEYNQNAASVLAFGKAQCSGYAKAVALLLNKFNIECFVAVGEVLTPDFNYRPHAWNIVKIGEDYYHLDSIYGHDLRLLKYKLDLEFFNIDDTKNKRTHKWSTQYPICNSNKFDDFNEKILLNNKPLKHLTWLD